MQLLTTKSFTIAALTNGDPNARRVAILMPGRLDTKDYINFVSHLDLLAGHGFYAVAIDPPGTWESPGDLQSYSTTMYLQTINELIDYFGNRPTLLLGHSRGGATAMLASANPAVEGVALVNAAYGKPHQFDSRRVTDSTYLELRDLPPGNVRTEQRREFHLPIAYFEDAAKYNPLVALQQFNGPKLIAHADKDEFVTIERVKEIYESLSEPIMFLELDSKHDYRLYPEAIGAVNASLSEFIQQTLN